MKPLTAQQIAEILGATVTAGDPAVPASGGVSTDTRKLPEASLFVALRGENFDGDVFASKALESGAAVVVVHQWTGTCPAGKAVIVVNDTLRALQKLAHWWRKQLDIPVVAITGSNG
jgi:UDP-N-acetylmuramoyl-tripeptide--D-alanyl-D-alanine ligase